MLRTATNMKIESEKKRVHKQNKLQSAFVLVVSVPELIHSTTFFSVFIYVLMACWL